MKDVFVKQKVTARMAKCVRVDVMRTGWVEAPAEYALASEVLDLRRRLARALVAVRCCEFEKLNGCLEGERAELKQRRAKEGRK